LEVNIVQKAIENVSIDNAYDFAVNNVNTKQIEDVD